MDTARLAAIRAREQAASRGPWESGIDLIIEPGYHTTVYVYCETENPYRAIHQRIGLIAELDFEQQADAEFIAAARADVPDLLAEVERLQAVRAQIEAEIARMSTETHRSVLRWVLRLLKGEQE